MRSQNKEAATAASLVASIWPTKARPLVNNLLSKAPHALCYKLKTIITLVLYKQSFKSGLATDSWPTFHMTFISKLMKCLRKATRAFSGKRLAKQRLLLSIIPWIELWPAKDRSFTLKFQRHGRKGARLMACDTSTKSGAHYQHLLSWILLIDGRILV